MQLDAMDWLILARTRIAIIDTSTTLPAITATTTLENGIETSDRGIIEKPLRIARVESAKRRRVPNLARIGDLGSIETGAAHLLTATTRTG